LILQQQKGFLKEAYIVIIFTLQRSICHIRFIYSFRGERQLTPGGYQGDLDQNKQLFPPQIHEIQI